MALARNKAALCSIIHLLLIMYAPLPSANAQGDRTILFTEDFESSPDRRWELGPGWSVEFDNNSDVLSGEEHYFATPRVSGWRDYSVDFHFRPVSGSFHVNFRETTTDVHNRYFLSVAPGVLRLHRQRGIILDELVVNDVPVQADVWQSLEIVVDSQSIVVYHDDIAVIEYTDTDSPLYFGRFSFESLDDTHVHLDNILVTGAALADSTKPWIRTGGPSGGLGYDVRIHPNDKDLMFVTDNPSGVNKSFDGGRTWIQKNTGITTKAGDSNDGIPIFSITIDPGHSNIVWAGTQESRGIYKSVDGGETWLKKDSGVVENAEISFRGFGVHPTASNIVFAGAEITTGVIGVEFDKAQGKIYRTEDGGEVWNAVWEGNSLVRFILFDYDHPDILYASTGIFDREAFNTTGEGLLKSTNGGFDWFPINNGIPDSAGYRFVGFIEMHPQDAQTLYAASGCNATGNGGVFKTVDGGASWTEVLSGDIFSIVTLSPSSPNVVYAGSFAAFYRSDDGGTTWDTLAKPGGSYGPPGIRAGVPISAVVDPENPYKVFANNYSGGNFVSTDGAVTWQNSSDGYTGAQLLDIAIDPDNPDVVVAIGRSGPFRSVTGGDEWSGISYAPAISPEWYSVAIRPDNNLEMLISGEFDGNIYRSVNGGASWTTVFDHPQVDGSCPTGPFECRHGFKAIEYAPSNPLIIYAGMCKSRRTINGDFPARASYGVFKSVDGGINWDTVNTGLPTTLLNINCIAIQATNANVAYVGTWNDGVYKTNDGGMNWVRRSNGLTSADIRSLAIHPDDTNIVYAGTVGAGIFVSSDGGSSWTTLNTGITLECPSYLLPIGKVDQGISLTAPARFRSSQDYYRAPWTSIRAIAIDPIDPNTMYAADYNSGVYTTSNGGSFWVEMNDSLTMRTVNALELSSDGSVLYAATFGGGVFRLPIGINHAPQIALTEPPNGSVLSLGSVDTVDLCVTAYDLDDDELSYAWSMDGLEWPGADRCNTLMGSELVAGYHLFEVIVADSDTGISIGWDIDVLTDVEEDGDDHAIPWEYDLSQNHPNPFNPSTVIEYSIPVRGQVSIVIQNVLGQTVRTLVNQDQPAGYYRARWDGTDSRGNRVATGVYFYRLAAGDYVETKKMILLK